MQERHGALAATDASIMRAARKDSRKSEGFTDEERAAMREHLQELKAQARDGRAAKADGERAVQLHAIIRTSVPALLPRTWYGMSARARDDKVVCFFQSAPKVKTRYATYGLRAAAATGNSS
jgi:hypothetical protein